MKKLAIFIDGKMVSREVSDEVYNIISSVGRPVLGGKRRQEIIKKYDIIIVYANDYDLNYAIDQVEYYLSKGYRFKTYNTTTNIKGYYNTLILGKK